MDKISKENH